jgi:predicted chitinase
MRHETKFARWIRSGGNSAFVVPLSHFPAPEIKFSVDPERLLDSIVDDALATGLARLNAFLPTGVSIDITTVDLTPIRDELREAVSSRLSETGVPVDPNDPVITAILRRYAERLNGLFQQEALGLFSYVWRGSDDDRVRAAHRENDDKVFLWSQAPFGGHPGQAWNCRCTAEPIINLEYLPDENVCDMMTGDRLALVFPDAEAARLDQIAREIDLRIVSGQLNSRERLIHFLAQMRKEAGSRARLEEDLDYRADRLGGPFRYFRDNPEGAQLYGRTDEHPADPVAIANLGYANRNGNGDAASGDGYRFRGRGLFQLTGRGNYRAFSEWHEENFAEDIDFETDPDRAAEPVFAVRSAVFFWLERELARLADAGLNEAATENITDRVNPGTDNKSRADRFGFMIEYRDSGQFDKICRFSVGRPRFEDAE